MLYGSKPLGAVPAVGPSIQNDALVAVVALLALGRNRVGGERIGSRPDIHVALVGKSVMIWLPAEKGLGKKGGKGKTEKKTEKGTFVISEGRMSPFASRELEAGTESKQNFAHSYCR